MLSSDSADLFYPIASTFAGSAPFDPTAGGGLVPGRGGYLGTIDRTIPPPAINNPVTQPFPTAAPPLIIDTLPDLGGFLPVANEKELLNKQKGTNNLVIASGGIQPVSGGSFFDSLTNPVVLAGGAAVILLIVVLMKGGSGKGKGK